jgi:hypothetical protein
MNGKGSKRRPTFVPMHEFGENWAKIFEKPKQKEKRMLTAEIPNLNVEPKKDSPLQKQTGGTHYKNMAIQPAEYAEKNGLSLTRR